MIEKKKGDINQRSKLDLDQKKIESARKLANKIALKTQNVIEQYTTTSIERSVCRLLGIDGVDNYNVPLPNLVVDQVQRANKLEKGVALFIGNAMLSEQDSPQRIAGSISRGEIDITSLNFNDIDSIKRILINKSKERLNLIEKKSSQRQELLKKYGEKSGPYIYVIVATGNIYEDITQAKAAARQGADIIAVIRSTAQSLLDYVPYGATTEGFGGTFATQENFRLMRNALDEVSEELGRYIRLTNYCSGLCMPEIATMGALERLDVMLNDALYGILFRDINMKRTLIDQYFSRMINAYAGVIINTGEDNYLTTADAYENAHTVLASQFINEQFAFLTGLKEEQMGLGHAYEMDPSIENGFLYELAQAQMSREIFPKAPLKYMPPTKFKTGNIFKAHIQDALFNMITIITDQKIHLLGMLTEAIHTPFLSDRALSIENAKYIFRNLKNLGDEISFKKNGIIQKRAKEVLDKAYKLLEEVYSLGLFDTIERGIFAGISRNINGGKGIEGVIKKDVSYYNPFIDLMQKKLFRGDK
ncbi:MAG: D-lysine 5,6-aminomutase subunit alpha [Candidatus Lokiarchaeota archaeon]|nr:D-lysine 5,6-aminomutase subunit alpha [Candidatus Lokiarchaeota archaeon]MBD3199282.1 D-lysine 5,6-aminomutase subunit alpha [Candidatus Lokiarchaeota archaeon]